MFGNKPFFAASVSNTKVEVRASGLVLKSLKVLNTTAAVAFLRVWNKASANVTAASDTPDFCVPLAANESATLGDLGIDLNVGCTLIGATTASGAVTGAAIHVLAVVN